VRRNFGTMAKACQTATPRNGVNAALLAQKARGSHHIEAKWPPAPLGRCD
jgi:hypothetical protein